MVIVRATDVPTYVQYGAADLGVAGKDVLIEHGGGLVRPSISTSPKCRMMVAVPAGFDYDRAVRQGTAEGGEQIHQDGAGTLRRQGVHVDLIKLYRFDGTGAPWPGWPMPSSTWCPPAAP